MYQSYQVFFHGQFPFTESYFRDEADKVETWTPNLDILEDTNLPPCQRGLLDVVVEVKGQESLTTTTTTTTTTPAPEDSKLLFEISFQTLRILH